MALRGMLGNRASSGSCTTAMPPARLMASSPAVPSSSAPVRTTPATRGPYAAAAERNSGLMAGRVRFSRGPAERWTWPARTIMWRSGGAT